MSSTTVPPVKHPSDQEIDLRTLEEGEVEPTAEVLVKSADRVRDLGEVFTPAATVDAMLDSLPDNVWDPHPSFTFFEPGCGDGNFLVAILARKLQRIADQHAIGTLAAGNSVEAIKFHALEALASIYAIDISPDNVIGGTPGHEVGARQRLTNLLGDWCETWDPASRDFDDFFSSAQWIVERNVYVGNLLPFDAEGNPTEREKLPLVEYHWEPMSLAVTMYRTTLGSVMNTARADATGVLSLFEDVQATTWSGSAFEIPQAQVPSPSLPKGPVRNGNGNKRR